MTDWLSFEQILGYVASAILLSGYAIKSDVKTKIVLIFSYLIFALHFFMLGAFTACAISIVSVMRNSSSIFFHQSKIVFSVFVAFYISSAFFTYGTPVDILPLLAALVTCFGMFLLGGIRFRILVVVATVLWTIHITAPDCQQPRHAARRHAQKTGLNYFAATALTRVSRAPVQNR